MKRLFTIALFIISYHANGQDTCLPKYALPVKKIQLSSGTLAYTESGKGRPVIFIHGLGGNISHWSKVITSLTASYTCIAIDLPGYGWSASHEVQSPDRLQAYSSILQEFIKVKKLHNVILAGHSMGAQVTVITALQNKKVKKLILVAPAGLETFTEKEGQLLTAATLPAILEKQDEAAIRNNFKINFVQPPAGTEELIIDRLRLKSCPTYKAYTETVSAGVKGMLAHTIKDSLRYLSVPVLILFGANDALIPNRYLHPGITTEALVKESAALIRKKEIVFIPQAGHMVPFEKPVEVSEAIKNFLK